MEIELEFEIMVLSVVLLSQNVFVAYLNKVFERILKNK